MKLYQFTILSIALLSAGCASNSDDATKDEIPEEMRNDAPSDELEEPSTSRLPGIYIEGSDFCTRREELMEPETFDDYVSGASGAVVGTVESLRPVYSPFVQLSPPGVLHDTEACDDLSPAVAITLRDVESLFGPAHEEITVRISPYIIGEWNAHFVYDDARNEGAIVSLHDPQAGIVPGMRIGMRYYEVDSLPGEFGTLSTPLFLVDEDEVVHVQALEESEFGPDHLCPGQAFYYNREIDAVHTGITLSTVRDGLADARARYAAGERTSPADSSRAYVWMSWHETTRESSRLHRFGVARCMDIVDDREWDIEDWDE